MIHRIKPEDDLSSFTAPLPDVTHLWRTASMSTWHLAVPMAGSAPHGIDSPCGAGGVSTPATLAWRGGMVVSLDDIAETGVVWQALCGRCEQMMEKQ